MLQYFRTNVLTDVTCDKNKINNAICEIHSEHIPIASNAASRVLSVDPSVTTLDTNVVIK